MGHQGRQRLLPLPRLHHGNFAEPIQIKPRNRRVTQVACMSCHAEVVHQMLPATAQLGMLNCVHCHSDVGHAFR